VPFGKCKLCLFDKELQESHYLPRSIYKSDRARQLKNQNPVVIGKTIRQDQEQITDFVFCSDCEQRFSKYGESWVLGKLPHDYGEPFPLQDALLSEMPFYIGPGLNLYAGAKIPAFNMDKLVYFSASIVWRGAIHEWESNQGEKTPEVELGIHEEPLRKFLLGEGPFPPDIWITTIIWRFKPVLNVAYFPARTDDGEWKRYWFYMHGLGFIIHFGTGVPEEIKHRCSQHTAERVVAIESDFTNFVTELTRKRVKESERTALIEDMLKEIEQIRGRKNKTS
jgi:hypothetical protein